MTNLYYAGNTFAHFEADYQLKRPRTHVGNEHHHSSVESKVFGSEGRINHLDQLHSHQTSEGVVAASQEYAYSADQEEVLNHCRIYKSENSEQDDEYEDERTQQQPFVIDNLKGPAQGNGAEDAGSIEGNRNIGRILLQTDAVEVQWELHVTTGTQNMMPYSIDLMREKVIVIKTTTGDLNILSMCYFLDLVYFFVRLSSPSQDQLFYSVSNDTL